MERSDDEVEKLVNTHIKFALWICGTHHWARWKDPHDARSLSLEGLLLAAKTWEPERGAAFTTWAMTVIRQRFWNSDFKRKTIKRGYGVEHIQLDEPDEFTGDSRAESVEDESVPDLARLIDDPGDCADMQTAILELREKERHVIARRFGFSGFDPMTLECIGEQMGVTREYIRQIEMKALAKLRKKMEEMAANRKSAKGIAIKRKFRERLKK